MMRRGDNYLDTRRDGIGKDKRVKSLIDSSLE